MRAIGSCDNPVELLIQFASDWLWFEDEPKHHFNIEELEALGVAAGLDLAAAWSQELAGPLSEAFFNLHNKEQLIGLADELSIGELDQCTAAQPKARLVEILRIASARGN